MLKLKDILLEQSSKKLRIFDFDDTLVSSKSRVIVIKPNGERQSMTTGEYAIYEKKPDDVLDYSEFSRLIDPRQIKAMFKLFTNFYKAGGYRRVTILTARASAAPLKKFFDDIKFNNIEFVTLGDSDPQKKAEWIEDRIKDGYNDIFFADDSHKNIEAVSQLKTKYPHVKWEIRLAKYR